MYANIANDDENTNLYSYNPSKQMNEAVLVIP